MAYIYLIRHAMPDIPLGERWCIGRTDLPLGTVGRLQAALLPFVPELQGLPVFCSTLSRAYETALALCPNPTVVEGLQEQDMGVWDGLSFTEIRTLYPELYAARELMPELIPAGSEPNEQVILRMRSAVLHCAELAEGSDCVIVSHKSAIATLTGNRRLLEHTSISVLDGKLRPLEIGRLPCPALDEPVCLALLRAAGVPQQVTEHCQAVTRRAVELSDCVCAPYVPVDRELLLSAALLHDIAKGHPDHVELGATWIATLGYPEVAELIRQHNDFDGDCPNEAALLFLADKTVQGTKCVTVEERFAASAGRCRTLEAKAAHARRYQAAKQVEAMLS